SGVPAEAQATARAIVGLRDAMVDSDTGQLRRKLSSDNVRWLCKALDELPAAERVHAATELMQLYFNGRTPKVPFLSQESERTLYRALRAAMQPVAAPTDSEPTDRV